MKYMVMVNGKYMTQVETDRSACGAEHIILDEIRYGMESALAFDGEAMKTEHFRSCLMACELVSLAELKEMSDGVKAGIERATAEAEREYNELRAELEKLQARCNEAWWTLNKIKGERGEAL